MQSKSIHEPFVRVVKRGEMPMKKKIAIRLLAVLLALVADALFIFFVTGLNPIDVYKAMIQGTFSTSMRFSWAMRDLASLLLIGIALAPAFKMRFWNTGAEGQVLMGALATAAVMVYYGGKSPELDAVYRDARRQRFCRRASGDLSPHGLKPDFRPTKRCSP